LCSKAELCAHGFNLIGLAQILFEDRDGRFYLFAQCDVQLFSLCWRELHPYSRT